MIYMIISKLNITEYLEFVVMASTTLRLGDHWEGFIKSKLQDGRYGSASELVRDSLRLLEERELKRDQLILALIEGENSGSAGKLDMKAIKQKARAKTISENV